MVEIILHCMDIALCLFIHLLMDTWAVPPFGSCEYTVCFYGHEMKKVGLSTEGDKQVREAGLPGKTKRQEGLNTEQEPMEGAGARISPYLAAQQQAEHPAQFAKSAWPALPLSEPTQGRAVAHQMVVKSFRF